MRYLKIIILILSAVYLINRNYKAYYEMRADKFKAETSLWRTSEQELFDNALYGGAVGTLLAMYDFPDGERKHKVSKASWRIGIPSLIINHIFLAILLVLILYKSRFFKKTYFVAKDSSTGKLLYFKIKKNRNYRYIIHDLPEDIIIKNEFFLVKSKKETPWKNKAEE